LKATAFEQKAQDRHSPPLRGDECGLARRWKQKTPHLNGIGCHSKGYKKSWMIITKEF
jgi:hypothetical protein